MGSYVLSGSREQEGQISMEAKGTEEAARLTGEIITHVSESPASYMAEPDRVPALETYPEIAFRPVQSLIHYLGLQEGTEAEDASGVGWRD